MSEDKGQGSSTCPSVETRQDERATDHALDRLAAVLIEIAADAAAREAKRLSGRDSPSVVVQEKLD